jgi:hypothetical protein
MHLPRTTFARHPRVKPANDAGSIANSSTGHTFAERRRAFSEIDYPLDPGQYPRPLLSLPRAREEG